MGKRKKGEEEQENAAERLPSDLLREILARVPYRSLCRFKCVSTAWLALCSDPAVRRRSISGFFCYPQFDHSMSFLNPNPNRLSQPGRPLVDPSLPFFRDCCCAKAGIGPWKIQNTSCATLQPTRSGQCYNF